MAGINYAGEYKVDELKLFASSGNVINLTGSYLSINIYEDIFSPCVTGTLTVMDTNAILMNAPVTGQDYLSIKLSTPGIDKHAINYTETVMSVYKIDTRVQPSRGSEVFVLHFCSPEGIRDNRVRVSKSYTQSIDTIIEDLLTNKYFINSNKDLFIESTKGVRKIVAPNSHPFKLINQLKREAISEKNGSPHYLFYENINGLHFRSLDSLYAQKTIGTYHTGDMGTIDFKKGGVTNIDYELKRVLDFQFNANNDTLKNIAGGMLSSNIISHDIYRKEIKTDDFDYFDDFYKFYRVNYEDNTKDNPIYNDIPVDEFDNLASEFYDSRIHLHPTSTVSNNSDAQHYEEDNKYVHKGSKVSYINPYSANKIADTYLSRQSKFMELNDGMSITMEVNGTTMLYAGGIIEFNMPISGAQHGNEKLDKYYSGKYLIQSTRHMFDEPSKKHTVMMTIVKDSLNEKLPINDLAIEPKGKKGIIVNEFYS